jgi:mono/diheme cytochrome c family protein
MEKSPRRPSYLDGIQEVDGSIPFSSTNKIKGFSVHERMTPPKLKYSWSISVQIGPIRPRPSVLARWVHCNARTGTNPVVPTPENLKEARTVYEAHCADCHGLDGSGHNRFEAEFNPHVAKLTGGVQKLSDSEVYFIVAHGIRNTAMPAFGKAHSSDDMWRAVLLVTTSWKPNCRREGGYRKGGSTRDEET